MDGVDEVRPLVQILFEKMAQHLGVGLRDDTLTALHQLFAQGMVFDDALCTTIRRPGIVMGAR